MYNVKFFVLNKCLDECNDYNNKEYEICTQNYIEELEVKSAIISSIREVAGKSSNWLFLNFENSLPLLNISA